MQVGAIATPAAAHDAALCEVGVEALFEPGSSSTLAATLQHLLMLMRRNAIGQNRAQTKYQGHTIHRIRPATC